VGDRARGIRDEVLASSQLDLEPSGFAGLAPCSKCRENGPIRTVRNSTQAGDQGKLEILLHGEKLRGSWTLMRIRGRDARKSGKTWFLMKHRDDEARPAAEYDITEDRPTASSASSRRRAARASTSSFRSCAGRAGDRPKGAIRSSAW
jgi:hypothetical protein